MIKNLISFLQHETAKHSLINTVDFFLGSLASFIFLFLFLNYSSADAVAIYYQFFAILKIADILFSAVSFSNVERGLKDYIGFYWIFGITVGILLSNFLGISLIWGTLTALLIVLSTNSARYFYVWQDVRRILASSGQAVIKAILTVILVTLNGKLSVDDAFMITAIALSPILLVKDVYAFPKIQLGKSSQGWAIYYSRVLESVIGNIDNSILRFFEQSSLIANYNMFLQVFRRVAIFLPFSIFINVVKRGIENTLGPKTVRYTFYIGHALVFLILISGLLANYVIFPILFPEYINYQVGNFAIASMVLLPLAASSKFLLTAFGKKECLLRIYCEALILYLLLLSLNVQFGVFGISVSLGIVHTYLAARLHEAAWKEIERRIKNKI